MAIERTLSIIKPDGLEKGIIGKIVARFEEKGLKPVGMPRSPLVRPARTSPSSRCSTPRRLTIRCPCTLDCPGVVNRTPFRPPARPPAA